MGSLWLVFGGWGDSDFFAVFACLIIDKVLRNRKNLRFVMFTRQLFFFVVQKCSRAKSNHKHNPGMPFLKIYNYLENL